MYRQYNDPRALEAKLKAVKAEYNSKAAQGQLTDDEFILYHEWIETLEQEVNFAWQDEEYDANN